MKIKFVLIKPSLCVKCNETILHEYGVDLETRSEYKQCIRCNTLTKISKEK